MHACIATFPCMKINNEYDDGMADVNPRDRSSEVSCLLLFTMLGVIKRNYLTKYLTNI